MADGLVVFLGPDDSDGDADLLVENVVGEFFLLVSRRHIAANDDRSRSESDLAANLFHVVPPCIGDGRCDEEIADVAFAEFLFFLFGHAAVCEILGEVKFRGLWWRVDERYRHDGIRHDAYEA